MLKPAHFFPIQPRGPHRPSSDPHHAPPTNRGECPRLLPLTFSGSFLVFFCRFLHLFQVKVRIVHKCLLAGGIIGFDFVSFVDKGYRVISERLSVHDTIVKWIRLYFARWVSRKCS
jgi:hypothetical protein